MTELIPRWCSGSAPGSEGGSQLLCPGSLLIVAEAKLTLGGTSLHGLLSKKLFGLKDNIIVSQGITLTQVIKSALLSTLLNDRSDGHSREVLDPCSVRQAKVDKSHGVGISDVLLAFDPILQSKVRAVALVRITATGEQLVWSVLDHIHMVVRKVGAFVCDALGMSKDRLSGRNMHLKNERDTIFQNP